MRLRNVTGSEELIAKSIYVCNQPETYRGNWNSFFKNENPIHIEIGMGKGKFITEMAKRHPDINYIGIEKYSSVLCRAVQKLEQSELAKSDIASDMVSSQISDKAELKNLVLICTDAFDIANIFGQGEVDRIYLNFSDPWPKERHSDRRLTSHSFLDLYKTILNETGRLEFKTDNESLFRFGLNELLPSDWIKEAVTFDLHRDPNMATGNVTTEYEEKFSAMGKPIFKFVASKHHSEYHGERKNPLSKNTMGNKENEVNYNKRSIDMELMIKEDNFQKEVLESDIPVLVDFYADWCGPCKMMAPVIAGLAKDYTGRCKIAKCNIDDEMELAGRYRVLSIPTIIIFKNGKPENIIVGAVSKKELVEKLEQALG